MALSLWTASMPWTQRSTVVGCSAIPSGLSSQARLWNRSSGVRLVRAVQDEEDRTSSVPDSQEPQNESQDSSSKKKKKLKDKESGQATATVTGALAVLLGVGYLVLVQLLERRGMSLEPPPPEAFEP